MIAAIQVLPTNGHLKMPYFIDLLERRCLLTGTISITDATFAENGAAAFAVTLSETNAEPVVVGYSTGKGTAKAKQDFIKAKGKLTFEPGQTTQTITLTLVDDSSDENDETVGVKLSKPTKGTTLADALASG